jgi:hypothetical protein
MTVLRRLAQAALPSLICEHCARPVAVRRPDGSIKVLTPSRAVFIRGPRVETNCGKCGKATGLGPLLTSGQPAPA